MIDLVPKFNKNQTYQAYKKENIFKCDSLSLVKIIECIKNNKPNEKVLIELSSTIGITHDVINMLTDNIDIRIIGGLTEEYAKSFKSNNMDYLREKATYSKSELESIITKIEKIESNIDPNWTEYEKALYLYEYMKSDITYRTPSSIGPDGRTLDKSGNQYRTRTWDTLTGLINGISTCNGYAHIYQELCNRQGIECTQINGKYLSENEGLHAWNLVTINNQSFIVDIIWDSKKYENGKDQITGFGTVDSSLYLPLCYTNKHSNLSTINIDWIKSVNGKISKNVPKEVFAKEKIEKFLKLREIDRQRMIELRQKIFINVEKDETSKGYAV